MRFLLDHLVECRGLERFADEIVADHLAYVRRIQSRHWDRRAEGCGFALKPFVSGDTVGGRRRSSEEGGPSRDGARWQYAPRPGRGIGVVEESLAPFFAEQTGQVGRVAGMNRLHQLIGSRAVESEDDQTSSRTRRLRVSGIEFFFTPGPD